MQLGQMYLWHTGVWSRSLSFEGDRLGALSVSSGLVCNVVAIYLTFMQFIVQLKLCLYTIVHLLLGEEFKNFYRVIHKYTISMSHNKSKSQSRSVILGPELESKFFSARVMSWSPTKSTRTLHPWWHRRLLTSIRANPFMLR